MNDYGKGIGGGALGLATALPATSAMGLFFADSLHPWIMTAFLAINLIWVVVLIAHISRYFNNRKA